ncbi:hypothetical protein KSP39_PZI004280 [Platanthera zijinensis]|uniref:RING-type E3 ubiquitin transferase BRCA1 n=1 Tax=Platanthera zijinensis TaxID=2320716 RepID=A0AAP0GC86_9ASPA
MTCSESISQLLNPFVLHLKKMESELTCPTCLKLLNQPMLLPCDHILCSCCSQTSRNNRYRCPVCIMPYERKDLRPANYLKKFSSMYKNMSSTLTTLQHGSSAANSDMEVPLTGSPISCNNHVEKKHTHITGDETSVDGKQSSPTDSFRDSDSGSWIEEAKRVAKRKSADILLREGLPGDTKHQKFNYAKESKKDHLKNVVMEGQTKVDLDGSIIQTCAFCHSFRTTETSGEMLHYLNGRQVSGDQASQSTVLHVHSRCLYWAPKIYFSGEIVMDLEKEISRASKLKCCSCGLKGAALGCIVERCRKTFHVPCAIDIPECRWDIENFSVLCPTHASNKFPCERAKSKKSTNPSVKPSVSSDHDTTFIAKRWRAAWISSSSLCEDWLLCGSGLSKEEKVLLDKFATMSGLVVTYQWKQNVTHVIAATNEDGACMRTMKYLMAILTGRWVLNIGWIRACLEAEDFVPEENYEITHDIHYCFDGPKSGRIRVAQKVSKLFDRFAFYFSGFTEPTYKSNLEDLTIAAGGKVVSKLELHNLNLSSLATGEIEKAFIVCWVEPPKDCDSAEADGIVRERLGIAEGLAARMGAAALRHTLFLNAIAAHDPHMLSEM